QAAAKEGAFIEFTGGSVRAANAAARIDSYADAIRKVGPEFCILSSDLGQKGNPLPADGLAEFVMALRMRGFSDQDLDRMAKQNPARLLGLQYLGLSLVRLSRRLRPAGTSLASPGCVSEAKQDASSER